MAAENNHSSRFTRAVTDDLLDALGPLKPLLLLLAIPAIVDGCSSPRSLPIAANGAAAAAGPTNPPCVAAAGCPGAIPYGPMPTTTAPAGGEP